MSLEKGRKVCTRLLPLVTERTLGVGVGGGEDGS